MTSSKKNVLRPSSQKDVNRFLQQVRSTALPVRRDHRARLIFGMDATASREPLWDRACHIQAQMFEATATMGGIEIQLAYYRGYGEFKAAPWAAEAEVLQNRMTSIRCAAGQTQIARVLKHALGQARSAQSSVSALVFVGDCMEEDPDQLAKLAGELGILDVPMFLFQDGADPTAAKTFSHIAKLTRGAHCRFDGNSAAQLRDLLCAVAVYAAGGRKALADHGRHHGGEVLRLIAQLDSRG
ncbi:MAG: VWA domain-containing protein [Arenicellales bacterium]|nr:MAG: hypothetical protein CBC21_05180 [Proteobacteria bacterium TMED61]RZO15703.1 MAG: VWA domain-containing protein [Candidatus Thioglobus sp.]